MSRSACDGSSENRQCLWHRVDDKDVDNLFASSFSSLNFHFERFQRLWPRIPCPECPINQKCRTYTYQSNRRRRHRIWATQCIVNNGITITENTFPRNRRYHRRINQTKDFGLSTFCPTDRNVIRWQQLPYSVNNGLAVPDVGRAQTKTSKWKWWHVTKTKDELGARETIHISFVCVDSIKSILRIFFYGFFIICSWPSIFLRY